MKIDGKRALVTGAGGFIGSHLVEALAMRGARVRAMIHYDARADCSNLEFVPNDVRKAIEVVSGDIADPFFVSTAVEGCDVVFHLAALIAIPHSYVAPGSFVTTNVQGTLNVLEACRSHEVERVVHTSTSETYGTALYAPIDEKHPLQGQSPYSATKIGADKLAESYHRSFGLPVATIRPFNTYGPRQSARAVVPTIISQALSSPVIRLGSLDPIRDLTFVLDTVEGFIAVAESDAAIGEVVNLGSGSGISIGELVGVVLRAGGFQKEVITDQQRIRPEKSEVQKLLCDNRKVASLTGWKPRFPLERGIAATIEFVRTHLELFRPEVYNR